jgi:pyruvate dehydrogenase E2 component (dihydrolipoamide acetyltransferase)
VAVRLAAELGVSLSSVKGTGPGGRIVKRDVEAAAKAPLKEALPTDEVPKEEKVAEAKVSLEAPPVAEFEDVPLSGMRKAIASRLVESKAPVPHFYVTAEADMAQALEAKEALERLRGTKVTVTDLLVKACGIALTKHPQINSSYQGETVRRFKAAHVGVVVATDEGLIIPVVKDAQARSLAEIASETAELADKGRQRKLRPEQYSGATFTISNLGMYGVETFSAVIAPPEGAILAVGSIMEKPVVRDGHVAVGRRMLLNLACDHRIIDGTAAAAFLNEVKELLEHPVSLLL